MQEGKAFFVIILMFWYPPIWYYPPLQTPLEEPMKVEEDPATPLKREQEDNVKQEVPKVK